MEGVGGWRQGIALRAAASGIWRLGIGDWGLGNEPKKYEKQIINYQLAITN
ncbi:hypothetical protein [Mastigocoleus sp. MO_188.B34]|uniref:hypothetical protein n=1 Tax=Mastigocoleus sp. MO_188.B34 TaxID=3036635 RepID=UPI002632EE99|nr:hypothetical protein [Mastigocoleus sp. MO_188.B34]MDJ0693727.1 hypothetical protein [Mastigocoleus sp. MO_188.B34]